MKKNSQYSYKELLRALNQKYLHDTGKTNYADELLKMTTCDSMTKLMSQYKFMSHVIFKYYSLGEYKGQLDSCLNENIIRVFREKEESSLEDFCKCYINVRGSYEFQKPFLDELEKEAEKVRGMDVEKKTIQMIDIKFDFWKTLSKLKEYSKGTNGYKKIKKELEPQYEFMRQWGYVFTSEEKSEIKLCGFDPIGDVIAIIGKILAILVSVLVVGFFIWIIGSGGGNWLLLILCLLLFLKFIFK